MRNYGQGASGAQNQRNKSNNKSFTKKLRYHFDNSISRAGNFVLYLLLISCLLGLLMTIIIYLMDHPEKGNFFDKWWESVTKILKIGAGDTWEKRILEFLFWMFGVAISGTVIGFITSGISNLIIRLKKGKSHVISTNHIVILGWSNRIFPILKELALANENVKNPVVLIFANMPREKMEDEINAKTKNLKNLKVVTRSGDPTNPKELEIVNINEAKSVVILDPDGKSDATVIATILAIRIVNTKEKLTIITEISDPAHSISLQRIRNFNIIPVMSDNIIANITAQACRQPGLGVVFLDFLDFEGDEIYFYSSPQLTGKTYAEALLSFEKSAVIGYIDSDNLTYLNPKHDVVITESDTLIVVAADDDKIFCNQPESLTISALKNENYQPKANPQNILFIGWSGMGNAILSSIVNFLPINSSIHIIYQPKFIDEKVLPKTVQSSAINITESAIDDHIESILVTLKAKDYNDIIIIGYKDKLPVQDADTQTLITMLHLNDYFVRRPKKQSRLVAQILDSSKSELARFSDSDELIVSDNLAALMIAQLIENPKLVTIFEELFDSEGASLNIFPIEKYVILDNEVSFFDLVAIASQKGESAIGIKLGKSEGTELSEGVMLNPGKSTKLIPRAGDSLIVICTLDSK